MRLNNSVIVLASGSSFASAINIYENLASGGGQPRQHMFNESNLNDLHAPNSTHSVNFNVGTEEWTWRVNVTSLSVPDARLDLDSANGPPLPDPRVVVTTFDLTWPNATETLNETAIRHNEQSTDGSAQTFGNSSTYNPICMTVVATPMWPNVTNKLQDDNDGDCEAVLGEDCVRALLAQPSYKRSGACAVPTVQQLDACQGVFRTGSFQITGSPISRGFYHDRDNYTTYYSSNGDDPQFNMSYLEQTHGGEGVWFQHSQASPEPNATAVRQAESQLRVMLLTLPGNGEAKSAVCTRVDPSIDDVDVSPISQSPGWDEDKSSGSGNGGDDNSSAAGPRFAATVGSVGVVGLAVAVFGLL